jgi:hypothetical protein
MKKTCSILGLILSFLIGSSFFGAEKTSEKKKVVHAAIQEAVIDIQKKYGLQLAGILEEGDKENENKYKVIGIYLVSKRYLSKREARKTILDMSKIFLEKLNTEQVQKYLTVTPFTERNIKFSITFAIANKHKDYSQFTFCGLSRGNLYFRYDLPNEEYKTREDKEEPYAEALKQVEEEEKETNINNQEKL